VPVTPRLAGTAPGCRRTSAAAERSSARTRRAVGGCSGSARCHARPVRPHHPGGRRQGWPVQTRRVSRHRFHHQPGLLAAQPGRIDRLQWARSPSHTSVAFCPPRTWHSWPSAPDALPPRGEWTVVRAPDSRASAPEERRTGRGAEDHGPTGRVGVFLIAHQPPRTSPARPPGPASSPGPRSPSRATTTSPTCATTSPTPSPATRPTSPWSRDTPI
jgi:hypothetical protein